MDNFDNQTVSAQKNFSSTLTERREAKGLSQTELAQKLYVTRQAVSKWEKGKAMPDAYMLLKIAEILDCTINDLITAPLPQSVDTTAPQTTDIHPPATKHKVHLTKKVIAVWTSVITIIIVCATLMGIYIPKSDDTGNSNPINPIYVDIKVGVQSSPAEPYRNKMSNAYLNEKITSQNLKAYWRFIPDFNSNYYFTCECAYDICYPRLLINGVEQTSTKNDLGVTMSFDMYMLADIEYIIELDYTQCEYYPNSAPNIEVKMQGELDNVAFKSNITIPANSEYTVMVYNSNCFFTIQNENVVFTSVQCQKKLTDDNKNIYVEAPKGRLYDTGHIYNQGKEIAFFGGCAFAFGSDVIKWYDLYQTTALFVTIANNNDYAINLDLTSKLWGPVMLAPTEHYVSVIREAEWIYLAFDTCNFQILSSTGEYLEDDMFDIYIIKEEPSGEFVKEVLYPISTEDGIQYFSLQENYCKCFLVVYKSASIVIQQLLEV